MVRLFLFVVLLITPACLACDCVPKPACGGGFQGGSTFFVGTPVSRRVVHEPNESRYDIAVYSVRITEAFSTNAPEPAMVEVRTGSGGGDCDWDFHLGTSYLLETRQSPSGTLWTSLCSWTNEASASEVLVRQLRAARDGRKQNSLTGSVLQHQLFRDAVTGRVIQQQPSEGWPKYPIYQEKPLPMVVVTARQGQNSYTALSDEKGIFSFPILPAGDYVLTPSFPSSLNLYQGENVGRDYSRIAIPKATDDEPFCRAFLLGRPAGSITGYVLGSKRFLKHLTVWAMLVERQDKSEIQLDFPKSDGRFVLGSLPPGHYQVVATTGVGPHRRLKLSKEVTVGENGMSTVVLSGKRVTPTK